VLLECLTGHREYEGAEIEAAVARLHRPPVIPGDLPFDLVRLLSLMTSLNPARRPSARRCAVVLRAANPPTRTMARPGRYRRVLVAASLAVLLAAAGSGFVTQNRATPVESAPPVTTTEPSPVQPVVEQPVVGTTVQPPVQPDQKGNGGKGKGKGKGKGGP
jgi:eukaryotic-like serine/threonine-protein kinase